MTKEKRQACGGDPGGPPAHLHRLPVALLLPALPQRRVRRDEIQDGLRRRRGEVVGTHGQRWHSKMNVRLDTPTHTSTHIHSEEVQSEERCLRLETHVKQVFKGA